MVLLDSLLAGHRRVGKDPDAAAVPTHVFDDRLRPTKQRALAPVVDRLVPFPPIGLTGSGLIVGVASAVAAAQTAWWLALILFLVNRLLDGLDGEVARARSATSDAGGYADMVVDTVVYAAIPIGAAVGSDIDHIWVVTSALLASFYVNTITWTYLSAVFEKRRRVEEVSPVATTIVMPTGLVEGVETIVFFVFMLAVPDLLDWTMGIMAATVGLGAVLRFVAGRRRLEQARALPLRVDA